MKAKIMYRHNWFGGDGWNYYPVEVEISDYCPTCGGRRGAVTRNRYREDGTDYYLDNWTNPCGHVDKYKNVYLEAMSLTAQKPLNYSACAAAKSAAGITTPGNCQRA